MRKISKTYHLSVEGETEKWYFDWLERTINECPRARFHVKLDTKISKEPLTRAKQLRVPPRARIKIYHVFDFESESQQHREQFQGALRAMKEATELGRGIEYKSAYSNFSFDLWMVLHRTNVASCAHRKDYLRQINGAFGKRFTKMDEYKREANFKSLLAELSLDDVKLAVGRAREMMDSRWREKATCEARWAEFCGYTYCLENPSTLLGELVGSILAETGAAS